MSQKPEPLVLVISEDLLFSTRLQDTLKGLGYRCQIIEEPAQLQAVGEIADRPIPLTEPLRGADAGFMRSLAASQPALVLIDLTASSLPWRRWLQIMKTSAATRRIPVIAYGPHVDEASFEDARNAGADQAVARGLLAKKLEKLVAEHARLVNWQDLADACQQPLSKLAQKGIELHNAGEYYEAHEFLEEAWLAEPGEAGFLYRALLQVTVTHLHIERGNQRGAIKMLLRVHQWLDPLPDQCRGIQVEKLKQLVTALRRALSDLPADSLDQLDPALLSSIPVRSEQ